MSFALVRISRVHDPTAEASSGYLWKLHAQWMPSGYVCEVSCDASGAFEPFEYLSASMHEVSVVCAV